MRGAEAPAAGTPVLRKGGLLAVPRGVMTPVFALFVAMLAVDVVIIVAAYFRFRYTNDPWGSAERMEFLAKGMASALAFGLVASIAAERRNRSPWTFLIGHAGFWVALALAAADWDVGRPRAAPLLVVCAGFFGCIVTLLATAKPGASPPPLGRPLRAICALTGACGNIWFGIALMGAIAVSVGVGTIIESAYTARAAQYAVYRAPWFGAVFFTAGLAMLCATLRKWPFRLEQAGWLTVHTGLALVVIGSMVSFLTTVEGDVEIVEGQRVDSFKLATQTRLGAWEVLADAGRQQRLDPVLDVISDFDLDPAELEPRRAYVTGAAPLTLTVDRFYGTAKRRVDWHDDGDEPRAGIILDVVAGEAKDSLRLDEGDQPDGLLPIPVMEMPVALRRARPRLLEAMLRTEDPKDHGKIVVRDAESRVVLEVPVTLPAGAESRPAGTPATLAGSAAIPGTQIQVALRAYYDNISRGPGGALVDRSPGNPIGPTVSAVLTGPEGEDAREVHAYVDEDSAPKTARYPYRLTYEWAPRIRVEGPVIFILVVDDQFRFVYASGDATVTSGAVEPGTPLKLPMPFVKVTPASVYRQLRIEDAYDFDGYEPRQPAIRITPSWDGTPFEPLWLPLGEQRALEHEGRRFVLSWHATSRPLGFSLLLHDFHRDFHPGSLQPSSFESYLRLQHPTKFPGGEDIKIDMNHPLRLDGWRLYQARFGNDRTTILQVNRDPGLVLIYPACAVVLLGLIVVFFMKKTLLLVRRKLEREGASTATHVLYALAAVAAVGIGPAIFSVYVAARPWAERALGIVLPLSGWPAFTFGLSLVALVPIMVVVWFTRRLHPRLEASLTAPSGASE